MLNLLNRFLLALLLLAGIGGTAAAEKRVALVIGNAAYANIAPLEMPLNDARRVSGILKGLGFEVIQGTDATKQDLEQLSEQFGAALIDADVGFFFYSGHGFQTSQPGQHHPVNHIVPVDFDVRSRDIARATLPLNTIVQALRRVRVGFIFMDACRDDPTLKAASAEQARGARGITLERGLGRVALGPEAVGNYPSDTVTRPAGMVIAYSTEPGKLALDSNKGTLSPFTTALAKHMGTPGLSIQDMLGRVSAEVAIDTKGKQTPWNVASLTAGAYQLVPKQAAPPSLEPPRKPAAAAFARPKPAPAPAPVKAEPKAKMPMQLP